jgi:hypothetical protein
MKSYPSINKDYRKDIYIYAFDKLDGSNIRAEWNPKKGFYKFGTKTQLIDSSSVFGKAIDIVKNKYQDDLSSIFIKNKYESAVCFLEYHGPSSFAGSHKFGEEPTVTLFDVSPYKYGLLEPEQFLQYFGNLDIPKLLYEGYLDEDFFNKVRQSNLPGMTFEGVVCKGANDKKTKMPIMFKIKSQAWLDKLKDYCKDNTKLFDQLS